jgi:hypothetical protein
VGCFHTILHSGFPTEGQSGRAARRTKAKCYRPPFPTPGWRRAAKTRHDCGPGHYQRRRLTDTLRCFGRRVCRRRKHDTVDALRNPNGSQFLRDIINPAHVNKPQPCLPSRREDSRRDQDFAASPQRVRRSSADAPAAALSIRLLKQPHSGGMLTLRYCTSITYSLFPVR